VKSEPKAFASLSSGLLARKGAARPAMRPQGFGAQAGNGLEDLGWNDMGFDPPKPSSTPLRDVQAADEAIEPKIPFAGLTPLESPVHSQQAEIVDRLSGPSEAEETEDETAELEAETAFESPSPAEPAQVEPVAYTAPAIEAPVAYEPAPMAAPQTLRRAPRPPRARSAPGSSGKAAFTLRLDPDRHLKLRLACAVGGRSAQQLVTDALDQLLAGMPELDAMAEKAKRKGS